jgi:hypothetical protein
VDQCEAKLGERLSSCNAVLVLWSYSLDLAPSMGAPGVEDTGASVEERRTRELSPTTKVACG